MTSNQRLLKTEFPDIEWSFDLPLASLSYFKLGGPAEIFYKVTDTELLKRILVFVITLPFLGRWLVV